MRVTMSFFGPTAEGDDLDSAAATAAATAAALENFRRLSKIHPQGSKGIFLIIICSIVSGKIYIPVN